MIKAVEKVWTLPYFLDKEGEVHDKLIVLEEELILASDFLHYMGQLLPILDKDESICSVSAWNVNGYEGLSEDPAAVFRVEDGFPGLGFMIRRGFYARFLDKHLSSCCRNRTWDGWTPAASGNLTLTDVIIPEVSRVYRRPHVGVSKDNSLLDELFGRQRATNLVPYPLLKDTEQLVASRYDGGRCTSCWRRVTRYCRTI
ncbi:PREDICTED: protein O-linked-mannose beta-1,2-N-acetylglucosaminyltransferase 1-like [Priapulus caudatus]|uniref:Alpha-1,3-mannosyl-glycoprotein 2-beta-N-acetylglucosaminyltransferase n=1 Tax=Priapulus caudatus TaxID=37621 RepID=A0ABM1EWM8_PRICU|nr:PREDICTED: protein O-linked-mannose beta-1,2-N-acetylglucosaminyltransferase 1-like [Priapulus caudatus]